MDDNIANGLSNRLYEKRKAAAYDLEKIVREGLIAGDSFKIRKIIETLCDEFIGSTGSKNARSSAGGLIGLAATSIALGRDVDRYLELVIPSVLSCFQDRDSRIRYYATESLYNIAKVAKGEVLLFFNEVFDALCRLAADADVSVKNGAELLDRLIKDIVSEKATAYVSTLQVERDDEDNLEERDSSGRHIVHPQPKHARTTAFSLPKFIPLLSERIYVINPYARTFLVSWISVLNNIPDLDLITYLPAFFDGIFKFLNDSHQDVRVATSRLLEEFLDEIKRVARTNPAHWQQAIVPAIEATEPKDQSRSSTPSPEYSFADSQSLVRDEGATKDGEEWMGDVAPGQGTAIDFHSLVGILLDELNSLDETIQQTSLKWLVEFFDICPRTLVQSTPDLLRAVLPLIAHESPSLRKSAAELNSRLLALVRQVIHNEGDADSTVTDNTSPSLLDFGQTVGAATVQLVDDHEETRVTALSWLMELHRSAPKKMLALDDGTFPALLKTLSDPSERVVMQDLQLLALISSNSEDDYFNVLIINLLTLFSSDRKLLEQRGSLIIRQLAYNLNAERIYRAIADNLEKEEDLDFASTMVQTLNNNLMTAPELLDLRRRLRNLEMKDGQAFFTSIYRCWCHNAVATVSLCLLAQAYEQASSLLHVFADLEITVPLLVQIDKLVQLLESPVFTYLRLQLLEPERHPYLVKCLYGLLMILPQTSAFTTLRNRLNSVGYFGMAGQSTNSAGNRSSTAALTGVSAARAERRKM
ncbi:hypothetical protein PYCC9005_003395 [Savitreella phatthalungensis]